MPIQNRVETAVCIMLFIWLEFRALLLFLAQLPLGMLLLPLLIHKVPLSFVNLLAELLRLL